MPLQCIIFSCCFEINPKTWHGVDIALHVFAFLTSGENEGLPLKRRRVSFGGHLKPELFDENLPPNTPLKKGETPAKRKSLGSHSPAVLKKIIKVS